MSPRSGSNSGAPRAVHLEAPAKVNLFLKILARRGDGYHDLETLFQAVDLCDHVTVSRGGTGVRLEVDGADLGPAEENLAYRAARLFLDAVGLPGGDGVAVRLTKRIPTGAGLGGGSSDAAAVLRCMDVLWGSPIPPGTLAAMAAALGSDVPFFLGGQGALALGTGRGEVLVAVPPLPRAHLVLVLPPVHVATGPAYGALARHRAGAPPPLRAPWDPGTLAGGWDAVARDAVNDFEAVVPGLNPQVQLSIDALRHAGGDPVLLSGSGAACFGIFPGAGRASEAAAEISLRVGWPALHVRTLAALPEPRNA